MLSPFPAATGPRCVHRGVLESAAIAVPLPGGGPSRLIIYAVPRDGAELDTDALRFKMQQEIRSNLNPLFKIHDVVLIDALPRTASAKVMRRLLRKQYEENRSRNDHSTE